MIFMLPEAVIRMFSGFTSRCTMPATHKKPSNIISIMNAGHPMDFSREKGGVLHSAAAAGGHNGATVRAAVHHAESTTNPLPFFAKENALSSRVVHATGGEGGSARTQGVQALERDEDLLHDGADDGRVAPLLVHALAHAPQHDLLQAPREAAAQAPLSHQRSNVPF